MRICSKCNKDVTPGQLYCPRCGFSLIKNKYGERVGVGGSTSKIVTPENAEKINSANMERNNNGIKPIINIGGNNTNKNNPASAAVIVIIFIISTCVPLLMTVFSSVNVTTDSVTVTSKYNLDSVIEQVSILADDNLYIRKYFAENGSTNLSIIADETSLEKEELTNAWCDWVASYNTEANAVLCTITAHSDLSDDTAALSALDELSTSINSEYYDDVNYDTLISIHDTLNSLYYLSRNSYDTYSDYEETYNTLNNNLNNYISSLE